MSDPVFFRFSTDGRQQFCEWLDDSCAGTQPSPAWIVCSGPSLTAEQCEHIRRSRAPVMAVNFAGRGDDGEPPLIEPDYWTTYDATAQFHRSIFLSPRIRKFCRGSRFKDLLPDGSEKLCDCPETYFFYPEHRGYRDFLKPGSDRILDSLDSMVQAIDIMYRLGYRRLYIAGADLRVEPSAAQVALAREHGVIYEGGQVQIPPKKEGADPTWSDRFCDFLEQCRDNGMGDDKSTAALRLQECERERMYRFSEQKPVMVAQQCDTHYWNTVQYLRQSRRCLSLCGLELISCTPGSRLNPWFRVMDTSDAADEIRSALGDPESERVAGRYNGEHNRPGHGLPFHQDIPPFPPKNWKDPNNNGEKKKGDCKCKGKPKPAIDLANRVRELRQQPVEINEQM